MPFSLTPDVCFPPLDPQSPTARPPFGAIEARKTPRSPVAALSPPSDALSASWRLCSPRFPPPQTLFQPLRDLTPPFPPPKPRKIPPQTPFPPHRSPLTPFSAPLRNVPFYRQTPFPRHGSPAHPFSPPQPLLSAPRTPFHPHRSPPQPPSFPLPPPLHPQAPFPLNRDPTHPFFPRHNPPVRPQTPLSALQKPHCPPPLNSLSSPPQCSTPPPVPRCTHRSLFSLFFHPTTPSLCPQTSFPPHRSPPEPLSFSLSRLPPPPDPLSTPQKSHSHLPS